MQRFPLLNGIKSRNRTQGWDDEKRKSAGISPVFYKMKRNDIFKMSQNKISGVYHYKNILQWSLLLIRKSGYLLNKKKFSKKEEIDLLVIVFLYNFHVCICIRVCTAIMI